MSHRHPHIISRTAQAIRLCAGWFACLLAAVLAACSHQDYPVPDVPDPVAPWDGKYYLTLNVAVDGAKASRGAAGPNGGENGDGFDDGTNHENTIYDATLLLYSKSINDASVTTADKVDLALYFDSFDYDATIDGGAYTCTIPLPFDLSGYVNQHYYVIAIANCGDMTETFKNMPLAQLADYKISRSQGIWQLASGAAGHTGLADTSYANYLPNAVAGYDHFMMSSYKEQEFTFSSGSSQNLPTITVQRLAARVDVGFNRGNWGYTKIYKTRDSQYDRGIEFVVYMIDPDTREPLIEEGHYVDSGERYLITSITMAKSYTGNEFLLKRTADNPSGDNTVYMGNEETYIDEETHQDTHKASNYVLMPSHSNGDYQSFQFVCRGQLSVDPVAQRNNGLNDIDYYILGYTRENVNDRNNYTGLIIDGYYNTTGTKNESDATDFTSAYARDYSFALRHSDPDGTGNELRDPMHYAIVRNNIYRVYIDNIFTDQKYVYVRWYYYFNNGQDEVDCYDVAFNKVVQIQPEGGGFPDD